MRALGLLACAGLAACTTSKPPAAPTTNGLDGSLKVVEVTPDGQKLPVSADGVTEVDVDSTLQVSVDGDKVTGAASGIVPQVSKQLTALGARMKELRALVDAQREVLTVLTEVLPKATKEGFHAALKEVAKKGAGRPRARARVLRQREGGSLRHRLRRRSGERPAVPAEGDRAREGRRGHPARAPRRRALPRRGLARGQPRRAPAPAELRHPPRRSHPSLRSLRDAPARRPRRVRGSQAARQVGQRAARRQRQGARRAAGYGAHPGRRPAEPRRRLRLGPQGGEQARLGREEARRQRERQEAARRDEEDRQPAGGRQGGLRQGHRGRRAPDPRSDHDPRAPLHVRDQGREARRPRARPRPGRPALGGPLEEGPRRARRRRRQGPEAPPRRPRQGEGGVRARAGVPAQRGWDRGPRRPDVVEDGLPRPAALVHPEHQPRAHADEPRREGRGVPAAVARRRRHGGGRGPDQQVPGRPRGLARRPERRPPVRDPEHARDRSDGSKEGLFAASPALTLAYHYRVGRAAGATSATGLGALWNLLDLGLGLHAVTLALPRLENGKAIDTTSIQLGLGPVLQVFGDVVQLGWGYDIQAERSYWFFGLGLKTMTDLGLTFPSRAKSSS